MDTAVVTRFERHVERLPESGCWLWTGAVSGGGYGAAKVKQRQWQAHRLSHAIYIGPIPAGMMVCHRCDVRICVNPEHLFLGTALDNMLDKVRKGRVVVRNGESNGQAKLTEKVVAEIRASTKSQRELAAQFGVAQTLISQIKRGVIWKGGST